MPIGNGKNPQFYGQWTVDDPQNWQFVKSLTRQRTLSAWIPSLSTLKVQGCIPPLMYACGLLHVHFAMVRTCTTCGGKIVFFSTSCHEYSKTVIALWGKYTLKFTGQVETKLSGIQFICMMTCRTAYAFRCVKDWIRNGSLYWYAKMEFCKINNSTSIPQKIFKSFKSPGPNMAPPTWSWKT